MGEGMKVWGMFHGGGNYAHPYVREDTEHFDSLAKAKEEFLYRCRYDLRYPCTGNDATMTIWYRDPREERDPYPDRLLSFGPREGLRDEAV